MKLLIVHNHFRPGGVRRVIELATPHLLGSGNVSEVWLVGGEAPDRTWQQRFSQLCRPRRVTCKFNPALGYVSEQPDLSVTRRDTRHFLDLLLEKAGPCVIWAHNQGLGRNLVLTRELQQAALAHQARLIFHHHDWWFDNRWQRWPEMRRSGFSTTSAVARAVFGTGAVSHATINLADARILKRHFSRQVHWLPNPADNPRPLPKSQVTRAREWLRSVLGNEGPAWLMPCRLLRRKNVAEALLLTRWLRPDASLVTTGYLSSEEERPYFAALSRMARRHHWPLRLAVLHGSEARKPAVPELMAASEVVLLTSLQEGFGLPYVESAAAGKPLIARALPNVMPDLARFGFRFPHAYPEILISPALFDVPQECRRQEHLYRQWQKRLPQCYRPHAGEPWLLKSPTEPVPFSRLTLSAQFEVLSAPVSASWESAAALNPFLPVWADLARNRQLRVAPWPESAAHWISGDAYARHWWRLVAAPSACDFPPKAAEHAQGDFVRERLATTNLYPLNWNIET